MSRQRLPMLDALALAAVYVAFASSILFIVISAMTHSHRAPLQVRPCQQDMVAEMFPQVSA